MRKKVRFGTLMLFFVGVLFSCKKHENNEMPLADAGASQVVQLPADSIVLQGSGSDRDGNIVSYSWSELSGPNTASIITDTAPTTLIKNFLAGTYVFQFIVIDNEGARGIDTVSVQVLPPQIMTVTLSNGTNSGNEMFLSGNNTYSFSDSTSPELDAFTWTTNGLPDYGRSLLKFDLSQIPAEATITSAKLTLFSNPTPVKGNQQDANYGSNNAMFIKRVVDNWTTSISWQTQPNTTLSEQILIPHSNEAMEDLTDIDVTEMVKQMIVEGNYGFMFRLEREAALNSRIFCSSTYPDATKHPKLIISYVN